MARHLREFGVSRRTAQRAARAYDAALRSAAEEAGAIKAIEELDVEYLIAFGIDSCQEVMRVGREQLARARTIDETVKVASLIVGRTRAS